MIIFKIHSLEYTFISTTLDSRKAHFVFLLMLSVFNIVRNFSINDHYEIN